VNIRVNHGYVRAGLDGRPEVNLSRRGSLVTEGSQGEAAKASSSPMSHKKIGEISEKDLLVNLIGTVVFASAPSAFTRSDGTSGQIASLQVGDETGQIRVVLWNEKAEAADGISENVVVEVSNGWVRRGQTGEIEIHLSQSSELRLLKEPPKGVGAPKLILKKIQDLKPGLTSVDVLARIAVLGQTRSFQRQLGGEGRVADVTLVDETGAVRLSLWDDRVELLKELAPGHAVLLKGAYTREGLGGSVALNLGRRGSITVNPNIPEAKTLLQYSEETVLIGELRDGFPASVEGEVSEAPSEKQITTRDGRELVVVSLRLRDDTGEIGVSFWNENAEKARYLSLGARVKIRDAFVRIGYDGDLELSTRSMTKLEILTAEGMLSTEKPGAEDEDPRLTEGDSYQGEALLVEPAEFRMEDVCPSCGGPLREMTGRYICDECGRVPEAQHNLVVEADLESGSRKFRAVFTGEDAEKLLGMKGSFAKNLVFQSQNDNAPLELTRKKLRGQRLKLEGTVVDSSPTHFRVRVSHFERVGA
jgi:replication factor A1